jgi:hypothetical protein
LTFYGAHGAVFATSRSEQHKGGMDVNRRQETFPCFMQCCAGDPSTDSSYVSARLKIGPHEMIVDFHNECFALFNERRRLGSGSRYSQYELLFQEMINRAA